MSQLETIASRFHYEEHASHTEIVFVRVGSESVPSPVLLLPA